MSPVRDPYRESVKRGNLSVEWARRARPKRGSYLSFLCALLFWTACSVLVVAGVVDVLRILSS